MVPRKRFDLSAPFLMRAVAEALLRRDIDTARRCVIDQSAEPTHALPLYSVRTAFDLMLQALALPAGDEVLLSAINIPDLPRIVAHHGLVPIPIDLDISRMAPPIDELERAWTPRVRMLIIAHLFGSRIAMAPYVEWCRSRGVILVEDAAQAYGADGFIGDPCSDICFFSFGPMKTATALGGAVALIRHDKLRQRMSEIERSYPVHAQRLFLRRTLLFSLAHLCSHPWIYGGFVGLLERRGVDLDDFLARSVLRAFYTGDFWDKLRRRPPAAMLRLLEHRLQFPDHRTVERRRTLAKRLVQTIGEERVPGSASPDHVHWVVPVVSRDPRRLIATLKREGYDASRAVSSLVVIDPPPDRPAQDATHARNLMGQIVYLPFDYRMTLEKVDRLGDLVARHESQFDSVSSHVSSERVDHRPATYPAVPGT